MRAKDALDTLRHYIELALKQNSVDGITPDMRRELCDASEAIADKLDEIPGKP